MEHRVYGKMANHFDEDGLKLKIIEECTELNEKLIKSITKNSNKPSLDDIVEEIGDTIFRIFIFAKKKEIIEKIEERIAFKENVINNWFDENYGPKEDSK